MKLRNIRMRYRTMLLRGPYYGPWRALGKYMTLQIYLTGYDDYNSWYEYLIARWK